MEDNVNKNPSEKSPNNQPTTENQPKIEITVKRHQQLFELLKDPNKLWRVLASLFLVIIVLFIGLAFVVISIKKFYPYNMIETNIQGASIVKSEDKDVIYWLFNTADLWANSGIDVQKGDILTIRASGSSFTAIHHLVDASEMNRRPQDKWVGTEGQDKDFPRDILRMQYRLCKDVHEGILLMKIINSDISQKKLESWSDDLLTKDIEVIGKERTLYISEPGVLHFAVNDIVLIDPVLDKMYEDYIKTISDSFGIKKTCVQPLINNFHDIRSDKTKKCLESIENINKRYFGYSTTETEDTLIKKIKKTGLAFGRYPLSINDSLHMSYPFVNELVYYKESKFIDAWYMDNLGSFLIVIERKRK